MKTYNKCIQLLGSRHTSQIGYKVHQELGFGVPQDSVLGPTIFCMYTKPISDIVQRHGLSHHCYADGTQLDMTMDHSNND